jgi:hypothetical protein
MLFQEQHLLINNNLENTVINNCSCQNKMAEPQQQQLFLTEITNHFSNSLSMEIGMNQDLTNPGLKVTFTTFCNDNIMRKSV